MNSETNMQNLQRVLNIFVNSEQKQTQPVLQTLSADRKKNESNGNNSLLKIIQAARNTEAMNQDYYDYS